METGLCRAPWYPEHPRDAREGQVEEIVQDHDGAFFRLEPGERVVEQVAVGDLPGVVEHLGEVQWCELDFDHSTSPLPRQIDAGMGDEAVQPVVERRWVAQPRQAAPRPDQRLLDGVLRQIRVTEDEASRGVQSRAGQADELGEGMPVAFSSPFHESGLVHDRLSAFGATWAAVLVSLRR
jgi:hypothetical protein